MHSEARRVCFRTPALLGLDLLGFLAFQQFTVRLRGMGTGISEASKRVPIFSFATQGGKQVSSYFRQGN